MMKRIGAVVIAVGIGMILFVVYSFLTRENTIHSPVPQDKGVKVIFVSPSP